jgi:photosystem II stability/assembly factor-like uncharacterized protein
MRTIGVIGSGLLVLMLLTPGPAETAAASRTRPQTSAWEALGPEGGSIRALAVNRGDANELLALSGLEGFSQVFHTTNGGRSWTRRAAFENTAFDLALAPDAKTAYILTDTGILKSENKGVSWTAYAFGAHRSSLSGKLAVPPSGSNTVFASGSYQTAAGTAGMAVFKSTDGGRTWTVSKLNSGSQDGAATALALAPSRPTTLYAAGYYSTGVAIAYRICKSVNGGASWSVIGAEISDQVLDLVVHPSNPDKVWAVTSWGIYRSSDGGRNWQRNEGFAFGYALAVDPANPDILYAGYDQKCYKSVDGGANWSEYTSGLLGSGQDIAVAAPAVYFASSGGLFKSLDGGRTWAASHSGITASIIPALGVAPSAGGTVYIEYQANGFYRSLNGGTVWLRLPDFYRCDKVLRIAVDPVNSDKLFILAGG